MKILLANSQFRLNLFLEFYCTSFKLPLTKSKTHRENVTTIDSTHTHKSIIDVKNQEIFQQIIKKLRLNESFAF